MKSATQIIVACLIILMLPAVILAINMFRMTDQTDPFNVTTGGAVTTADVTLSQSLFDDATYNVVVTSNNTADAPIASTYTSATKLLHVTGLNAEDYRQLSVVYKIDALSSYYAAGVGTKIWPIFLVLGTIGLIIGAVYTAMKSGGE